MAMHCPNCRYASESDYDDTCPICLKPLLTQKEFDHDWGAHVGNPGPWHHRYRKTLQAYNVIWVIFTVVLIAGYAIWWWQANP